MKLPLAVSWLKDHWADVSMTIIIGIWGFHFIIIKDALADLPPLAFNAIRFSLGAPVLLLVASRRWSMLRLAKGDFWRLLAMSLFCLTGYQVVFVLGLERTTATNAALLVATTPTWTAIISMVIGLVSLRRMLSLGLAMTFAGVVLVVLGRSGASLAISEDDLIGSGLVLYGAIVTAVFIVWSKRIIERNGGLTVAIWTHWFTWLGLLVVALPDLVNLSPANLPVSVWPNLFYSGILAGAGGYLTWNNAVRAMGPTRATTYNNFIPIVAAFAGIVVIGEPFTLILLVGGVLTLTGVAVVRMSTRPGKKVPVAAPSPTPAPALAAGED